MIRIIENHSLKFLNSFGVEAKASRYISLESPGELADILSRYGGKPYLVLGEGSNILFTGDYKGTVIHPRIQHIEIVDENDLGITIRVGCGENWDSFVKHCVINGWSGLENLSLIPGSTGSAPVQNIGAYGVEVKDRILWVEGLYRGENEIKSIPASDCKFGYRSSIFKSDLKEKFVITAVIFKLDKTPRFVLNYGNLATLFENKSEKTPGSLRETIIEIRESKLPDPKVTGNAGSFFKNPVIHPSLFSDLRDHWPEIPSYPSESGIKIPAAWLIEKAGWKGVREGDVGTWPEQPLVIVNYGNATGKQVLTFSMKIQDTVREMFGIELETEVNIV